MDCCDFSEFTETGSHLALTFKEQELNRKAISAGFDISYEIPSKNWLLRPFSNIEYSHDLTDDSNVDMHYANDSKNYRLTLNKKKELKQSLLRTKE